MTDTALEMAGGDALRSLCLADPVFSARYEGWHVLGRGMRATVVRTRSRDLAQDVALKVFVNLDPELLDRVREEVRAVQALATPYLAHTYSLFGRGPVTWFEMELVDGPNLQQELDRHRAAGERIALVRALEIGLAVSRCVWHAHRNGVLHRDIKPANVLLPRGGRPAAKLTDFGIARLADTPSTTPPGAITGTPRFASPEALAGENVGPPHDAYGLGATLYTLLTGGRPPYPIVRGASLAELRRQQRTTRPTPLRDLVPDVDAGLAREVQAALRLHPPDRPGPGRLVQAIEQAQAHLLVDRGACRAGGAPVSHWRVVAGMGLAALGLWKRFGKGRRGGPERRT